MSEIIQELAIGSQTLAVLCWGIVGALFYRERIVLRKNELKSCEFPMLIALFFTSHNFCHFILFFIMFIPYVLGMSLKTMKKFISKNVVVENNHN